MNNPLPASMRAIEISAPGGPEVLKPVERPLPVIKDHEVLIKVTAAGINGPDIMQRKGLYPAPAGASDLPGLEVSGVVAAKGKSAQRWTLGDKVVALTNGGGYAEYVAADATHCLAYTARHQHAGCSRTTRDFLYRLEQRVHRCRTESR